MAENTVNKYLDLQGLQLLWQKISEKYPRTEAVNQMFQTLEGKHDEEIDSIEKKILELEASIGSNADGDTIINNGGILQTNLMIDLDSEKKTLRLVTKNQTGGAQTVISELDYTPFVKDGMLDSVSIVVVPEDETEQTSGKAPGTYLKFIFNTNAGKEAIYLDVSEFTDIYEGSNYIIVKDNVISINETTLDAHIEDCIVKSVTITDIVTRLSTAEANIQTLTGQFVDFESRIQGVESTVSDLDGEFKSLKENVLTYDGRISDLETAMENVPTTPISEQEINDLP